jgi:hypothetical protein
LTPFESTIRSAKDNEFIDVCEKCLTFIDVKYITREDLRGELGTEVANYIDNEGIRDD